MKSITPSAVLRDGRSVIRALALRHRTKNPRVFGSVLTGQDSAGSDLDLLVEPMPDTTLFDLGGLQDALEEALGIPVDVNNGPSTAHPRACPRSGRAPVSDISRLGDYPPFKSPKTIG